MLSAEAARAQAVQGSINGVFEGKMSNFATPETSEIHASPDMLWIRRTSVPPPQEEVTLQSNALPARHCSLQKLKTSVKRILKQFRILRRALVHPQVPWHAKAVAGCAFLYVVSPIQLIPTFIPVIGQMDDALMAMLAIKYLQRYVPQPVLDECDSNVRISRRPKDLLVPSTGVLPNS
jgi:uncharacterized membrane protein YkvA (DUF1232 family)